MVEPTKPFDLSALPFGQWGPMLESVELMNKTWSSLSGIPSRMLPTVDVEELGQRITELKAVEQWLTLNLNVLRNTIQGMTMQRDTLSAVKAMSASLGETAPDSPPAAASPWAKASEAFPSSAFQFGAPPPAAAPPTDSPEPAAPFGGFGFPFSNRESPQAAAAPAAGPTEASAGLPPSLNPGLWWSMLQHNFSQVAEAALAGVARPSPAPQTPEPAAKTPDTASAATPEPDSDAADTAADDPEPTVPAAPSTSPRPFKSVPLVRPSRSSPRSPR